MKNSISFGRCAILRRFLSALIVCSFTLTMVVPPEAVYAQTVLTLPAAGTVMPLSNGFVPLMIKGINLHAEDALKFDFIIDKGDTNLDDAAFREESTKLIKYFLASLTIPEDEMWVNLSPYEKGRIIPENFGRTEMGRDMLAQDYMLKQVMSSVMSPENEHGRVFWDRVYARARQEFGTDDIPLDTFTKVWIIADEAKIYEHEKGAFVVDSHMKVMLEADYFAMRENKKAKQGIDIPESESAVQKQGKDSVSETTTSEIIREIIVPEIEKEVNTGETFATLRQIYNAMILASWYKKALKDSIFAQVYVDQAKTAGVDNADKSINQKIYDQYVASFKKGVADYIKEEYDPVTQQIVPKKYFTGGVMVDTTHNEKVERIDTAMLPRDNLVVVTNEIAPMGKDQAMIVEWNNDFGGTRRSILAYSMLSLSERVRLIGMVFSLKEEESIAELYSALEDIASEQHEVADMAGVVQSLLAEAQELGDEDSIFILQELIQQMGTDAAMISVEAAQEIVKNFQQYQDENVAGAVEALAKQSYLLATNTGAADRDVANALLGILENPEAGVQSKIAALSYFTFPFTWFRNEEDARSAFWKRVQDALQAIAGANDAEVYTDAIQKLLIKLNPGKIFSPSDNRIFDRLKAEFGVDAAMVSDVSDGRRLPYDTIKIEVVQNAVEALIQYVTNRNMGPLFETLSDEDLEKHIATVRKSFGSIVAGQDTRLETSQGIKQISFNELQTGYNALAAINALRDGTSTDRQPALESLNQYMRILNDKQLPQASDEEKFYSGQLMQIDGQQVWMFDADVLGRTLQNLIGLVSRLSENEVLDEGQNQELAVNISRLETVLKSRDYPTYSSPYFLVDQGFANSGQNAIDRIKTREYRLARNLLNTMLLRLERALHSAGSRLQGDRAMLGIDETAFTKGGIDFNPENLDMQIQKNGDGVIIPLAPPGLENMNIDGFVPLIINVAPVTNLPMLIGMTPENEGQTPQPRPEVSKALWSDKLSG